MKTMDQLLVLTLSALAVGLSACGSKGSNQLPAPSNSIYSWESSTVDPRGNVIPSTCGLTSNNCTCNLTVNKSKCILNFSLNSLSPAAYLQVKPDLPAHSAIHLYKSKECSKGEATQITNCTYTFKWDKSQPDFENVAIQLSGSKGTQTLINLKINAE